MNSVTNKPVCAITGSNGYVGGCLKNYFAARASLTASTVLVPLQASMRTIDL